MLGIARRVLKRTILQAISTWHQRRIRERGGDVDGLSIANWDMAINEQGHLLIQGCDVTSLVDEYASPLYVVDKQRLKKNYTSFLKGFLNHYPHVEIGYSYKTNPLPGVISALHEFGASAEVISHFELWLALRLGVVPEQIIFNGPGKTPQALELAVSQRVKIINIDGPAEIDVISGLAKKYAHTQPVGVRVVTSVGWSSQFGLSIADGAAYQAFQQLCKVSHVDPCGLHIHLGTGIRNIQTYLQAIREGLEFARLLKKNLGIEIRYFDFGGGFGVPTVREFSELDVRLRANGFPVRPMDTSSCPRIEDYARGIAGLMHEYYAAEDAPQLIFEPGRAISSSAQSLLLQVLTTKPAAGGFTNVILNGGKNITMPLGYEYHEVFAANRMQEPRSENYNVFGPLCHPGDVLFKQKKLPRLMPGDILAIMDAGAYFVPNQMNFSNPRPAAVMLHQGRHELIRDRETFENVVGLDRLPPVSSR